VVETAIDAAVRERADLIWDVALRLHADPELAFAEHRSAALLCERLADAGFTVQTGVAGLPTAFTARWGDGDGRRVALLLEYDALPGLGHACGHNLIAAAGLGAALALRAALEDPPGTLLVVGTPAEEGGGGKIVELDAGVFDGVDAALMFHPGARDWTWAPLTAQAELRVTFHGRAAHPTGDPTGGIDALAPLIQLFGTLNALQRRLPAGSHVQGVITRGGVATNIVPDLAEGVFGLRGLTTAALEELAAEVTRAARGTALATGTTVDVERVRAAYAHFRPSDVLGARFARHLADSGIVLTEPDPGVFLGSSDIGNVSATVPAIHPFVAVVDPHQTDHTAEFAAAAASPRARDVVLAAATALARTAADVLLVPGVADAAWEEFRVKEAGGE
jgi:amidohydrolase